MLMYHEICLNLLTFEKLSMSLDKIVTNLLQFNILLRQHWFLYKAGSTWIYRYQQGKSQRESKTCKQEVELIYATCSGETKADWEFLRVVNVDISINCAKQDIHLLFAMASPTRVILIACGSYNPVTNMHLRMFGKRLSQFL